MSSTTISPVRSHMLSQLTHDFGRPIRAAVQYHDEPSGLWSLMHGLMRRLFRVNLTSLREHHHFADALCGLTRGFLVLAEDATVHRICYEDGETAVIPVRLDGANFHVRGGQHYLHSKDRSRCKIRYAHTCWYDEAGKALRQPNVGAEAVAMVDELSQFLHRQTNPQTV